MRFIEGKLVSLKPHTKEDIPKYLEWLNDYEVRRYNRNIFPVMEADEQKYLEARPDHMPNEIFFDIWANADQKSIGFVGLHHLDWISHLGEIGLTIGDKSYWKKGYATEAAKIIIDYGFLELNLHKICATVLDLNIGSWTVAEKNGMHLEGVWKSHDYVEGEYRDLKYYAVFKDEWLKKV